MCMGGSDTTRRWYWQFIRVIMEWCSSSIMQSWVKTIFMFSSSPPPFDGSSLVCQTELLLSAFYSFIYSHSRLSKVEHGLQQRGRGQKWARRRVGRDGKQCDQIGRFLKVLGDKDSIKSTQNAWRFFWANVKSNFFHSKLLWLLFGPLLEKFGLLLIQHLVILVWMDSFPVAGIEPTKSHQEHGNGDGGAWNVLKKVQPQSNSDDIRYIDKFRHSADP